MRNAIVKIDGRRGFRGIRRWAAVWGSLAALLLGPAAWVRAQERTVAGDAATSLHAPGASDRGASVTGMGSGLRAGDADLRARVERLEVEVAELKKLLLANVAARVTAKVGEGQVTFASVAGEPTGMSLGNSGMAPNDVATSGMALGFVAAASNAATKNVPAGGAAVDGVVVARGVSSSGSASSGDASSGNASSSGVSSSNAARANNVGNETGVTPEDRRELDFLHGTTINVGLDGYYEYNFNAPVGRVNLLRAYDVLSNNFSLNQASVIFEHAPNLDEGRRWGGRVDLQYGQATDTLQGNPTNEPRPAIYQNIFQAYGTYIAPVGKGLAVDFGKFSSSIGIEGNYTKDQMNYSRSYYFDFLPFYHMGLRVNYPVNERFTLTYWVVNGTNQAEATNGFKDELFWIYGEAQEIAELGGELLPGAGAPGSRGGSTDESDSGAARTEFCGDSAGAGWAATYFR
jgi:hypothetical protein